tara:strand:+ start:189 stop:464 length:276 start_codon:yes stop_codon:yes gene_type:complete
MTKTSEFITNFTLVIDYDKDYTRTELSKLLTTVYNNTYKKKKEPTKYNLFIKENIIKLKKEFPHKNGKELMKMASENWQVEKVAEEIKNLF